MTECYEQRTPQGYRSLLRASIFLFISTCLFVSFVAQTQSAYGKGFAYCTFTRSVSSTTAVYQYHVAQVSGSPRYAFSTNPVLGRGWIRDSIAFTVYTQPQTGSKPVYQYHMQLAGTNGWAYTLSTKKELGGGWTRDCIVFYAFTKPSSKLVPIYQYHVVQPDGVWSYYFSTDPSLIQTWIPDNIVFYTAS